VRVEAADAGARLYVALNGRISAEPVLGSVAPDRALGLGRRLAPGDALFLDSRFTGLDHPFSRVPLFRLGAPRPVLGRATTVDVTAGPDAAEFDEGWSAGTFEVSPQSDAVGLRLAGPVPPRSSSAEILSRGVPVGAVEVPPAGGLIVLLRGRFVTAGYPIVAVAATTALDRLGQVRPGDTLTFRIRTAESTRAELREREQRLAELAARVARAYRHVGLADVVHEDHLSSAPARVPAEHPRPRSAAAPYRGGPAG
jgi:allophanate hydrolase subunit 2